MDNISAIIDCYSKNLQLDFNRNTDIKTIHLRYGEDLLIPFLNNYIPFATFVKYLKFVIWAIAVLV